MTTRFAIALAAATALALSAGAALAQMDPPPANDFYGDPVLPDPPLKANHVFPASIATEVVAAVAPAASAPAAPARAAKAKTNSTSCTALNPCAVTTPEARS